jgi:hypothetical protein
VVARKSSGLVGVLIACVLAGCAAGGGADTFSATATPSPVVTPTPVVTPSPTVSPTPEPVTTARILAVAGQFWWGGTNGYCPYLECPITPRLATRMAELIKIQLGYPTGGGDLWCRCQNAAPKPTIMARVTPGGGTATVDFGLGGSYKVDFLMVVQDGKLLLDDTQCTEVGPSTSIYTSQGMNPCN